MCFNFQGKKAKEALIPDELFLSRSTTRQKIPHRGGQSVSLELRRTILVSNSISSLQAVSWKEIHSNLDLTSKSSHLVFDQVFQPCRYSVWIELHANRLSTHKSP